VLGNSIVKNNDENKEKFFGMNPLFKELAQ
jgi:hypothetical protein